jgi:hypothetical protein
MTSEERREARHQRRAQKRKENRIKRMQTAGAAEDVYSYRNLYKYGKKCCNGVRWKQSAQTFEMHLFSRTARARKRALSGKYKPKKYVHFMLNERGKIRPIDAPHIDDRQIQKTLSCECLYPLYRPGMIDNNAASIKGEGLSYAQKLLKNDLRKHYKKYGRNGWIILTDMHHFFPSADHGVVKANHSLIADSTLRQIADSVTDSGGNNGKGEPLGVEPSQFEMIYLPSPMDNYMTCQVGLSGYGHYMDDFYMLVPPDKDPGEVLLVFEKWAKKLKLTMNPKKTQVLRFGKPFRFCKAKYIIKPSGKVIEKGSAKSLYRCARKIKKLEQLIKGGTASYEDLRSVVVSGMGYYGRYNDHAKTLKIARMFYSIYGFNCNDLATYRRLDNEIHMRETI